MNKLFLFLVATLIAVGVVFQGVAMFRSGHLYSLGVGYWGPLARDGVWHQALVAQINKSIPPQNPGLSGVILTNYHYFFDILVAWISHLTSLSPQSLIYIIFPIIFSILLGIGTFKLTQLLFNDKITSLISVFFAYFASSFGWIVSILKHQTLAGESDFWASQPVSMNLNPPFAISLVIIIFVVILVTSYIKKPNFLRAFVIIVLSGTLIEFKVYGGAVLLGGLLVLALKRLYFDHDFKLILVSITSILLALAIFVPLNRQSLGLIEINPLWLPNTMIDAGDRVGIASLSLKRITYGQSNQWLKFATVEVIGLIIFLLGNLGTRIVGIFALKKKQLGNDLFIFIFAISVFSLIPTLVFTQKGNPWNIVQFFYYGMYFSGMFAAYSIRKFPIIIAMLIMVITPISSISTFKGWFYPTPPAYLSIGEYDALKYLSIEPEGVVLKHPFDKTMRDKYKDPYPIAVYADNAYISAYSGKPVYIEDAEQQIVLNTDYAKRLEDANRFFVEKDLSWSSKFLHDNNISYIYLPKIYHLPMAEGEYPMKKIFENGDANIYKVN